MVRIGIIPEVVTKGIVTVSGIIEQHSTVPLIPAGLIYIVDTLIVSKLPPNEKGNFYEKIRSFLDTVKEGGKAPVPTSQIIYNQAIIDGILKSSDAGCEIKIEIPEY